MRLLYACCDDNMALHLFSFKFPYARKDFVTHLHHCSHCTICSWMQWTKRRKIYAKPTSGQLLRHGTFSAKCKAGSQTMAGKHLSNACLAFGVYMQECIVVTVHGVICSTAYTPHEFIVLNREMRRGEGQAL